MSSLPRLLITAGPTHEPIDAVRYVANRSSGRLGIAMAVAAAQRGWPTTLLLGPTPLACSDTRVNVLRFCCAADLGSLLDLHVQACDCLIMAAAVADFRPRQALPSGPDPQHKLRRQAEGLILRLEPTPDLLARAAETRRDDQLLLGFALEPRATLLESAMAKLTRKRIDLIVANPLETMGSGSIEATLIERAQGDAGEDSGEDSGGVPRVADSTSGAISKEAFAQWLLDRVAVRISGPTPPGPGVV